MLREALASIVSYSTVIGMLLTGSTENPETRTEAAHIIQIAAVAFEHFDIPNRDCTNDVIIENGSRGGIVDQNRVAPGIVELHRILLIQFGLVILHQADRQKALALISENNQPPVDRGKIRSGGGPAEGILRRRRLLDTIAHIQGRLFTGSMLIRKTWTPI